MEGQPQAGAVNGAFEGPAGDVVAEQLTDRDRMIIRETRTEIRETPLPPDRGPLGCVAGLVGLVVLIAWPPIVRQVPAAAFFSPFVMLGGVLALIGGPVASFFGGSSGRSQAHAALESGLRHLEDAESDRETRLRAATLVISHAYISQGPTTSRMLDPDEARPRIGPAMPLVLGVEQFLEDEFSEYSIFSLAPDEE